MRGWHEQVLAVQERLKPRPAEVSGLPSNRSMRRSYPCGLWTLDEFAHVQDRCKRLGKRKGKPRSYIQTKLHSPEWLNQAVLKASIKNGGGTADSEKSEEQVTCTDLQV